MFGLKKEKKNWHKWLLLIVLIGVSWPSIAYQEAPPFVGCTYYCTFEDLLAVPASIFNWILGLAGLVFLGVIVWGGARMTLYYISESPETELVNAKLTIKRGIFGFLVIAFSYLIVQTLVYTIFGLYPGSIVGGWLSKFGL